MSKSDAETERMTLNGQTFTHSIDTLVVGTVALCPIDAVTSHFTSNEDCHHSQLCYSQSGS